MPLTIADAPAELVCGAVRALRGNRVGVSN